jgi:primosomal protein N' (replication factor Y)
MPQKQNKDQRIGVILPLPFGGVYDYLVPSSLEVYPGMIVRVDFGKKSLHGVVWHHHTDANLPLTKLKYISATLNQFHFNKETLEFLKWVSTYTMFPLGAVLKMMLSVPEVFVPLKRSSLPHPCSEPDIYFNPPSLELQQEEAVSFIKSSFEKGYSVTLLEGVTGSGKTEIYLELIRNILREEKQVLILLPHISLAPQIANRFEQRFGVLPILWHSSLTKSQRREAWKQISQGDAKVVMGARSSLFLPYSNLGMIIVDEEHDLSYKQEEGVIYQARDLAVTRAYLGNIPCLLSSATPSLETLYNCSLGRYRHFRLNSRYGEAQLPRVHLIDMRHKTAFKEKKFWISDTLANQILATVTAGEQALLYLNRRGYAPLTLCGECGEKLNCPYCSAWLVHHRKFEKFLCHYCGHTLHLSNNCLKCGSYDAWVCCGPGVERITEEVNQRFPSFRTATISSDLIEDAQAMTELTEIIQKKEVDILIGTQLITTGYHFPHLTLVGIIDADLGLSGGDLRASEKTHQTLQQVSGRAGREKKLGQVYLQTYNPDHPVLNSLLSNDREDFITQELHDRKKGNMPPFTRLAALIFSSLNHEAAKLAAQNLARCAPYGEGFLVLGPSPAPLSLVRGKYRWRMLLQTPRKVSIQSVLKQWLNKVKIPSNVTLKIDIDPYSFL